MADAHVWMDIVGKTQAGSSISSVAALNGATEENHGSTSSSNVIGWSLHWYEEGQE